MECSAGLVFFMQEVMRLKKTSQTTDLVLALFLYIPVIWAALLIAQSLGGGLPELLSNLTAALEQPFQIQWTDKSLLSILVGTGAYLMGLCLYASGQGRTRDGEEHGSAAWGSPRQLNAQFRQKQNKILTRHVRLGLDTHKHRRSLNVLVIGGSGAAKTRGYVKPNILEANSNYVITDPKMEVLTATGGYLKRQGYDIRVLNLVDLSQSDGYNPFRYLRDEKDALKLVNTLIQATTPKGSHESDPFWSKSETALLQAIILMLFQEAPEYEQNFSMVLRVLEYAEVKEDDDEYVSPLDLLFRAMEYENPESVALRQYKVFKQAAGKTAKSILVSAAVRLAPFNLPQIKAVTDHDDMDLYTLGERKCALYAVIPDNDTTFTFLVSLLYSQIFQTLYYCADQIHHGALPCHVHFILDEAPSVNLPGLPRELATPRSSRPFTTAQTRSITEPCPAMCISSWMKRHQSICRGCRGSLRPCAHATYPAAPSSRTWRRSRSCIRTHGKPSPATRTRCSIWAVTRQAPTSTFPRRWASPPSTPRPTGRPKGGPGLTPPTSRSVGGNC